MNHNTSKSLTCAQRAAPSRHTNGMFAVELFAADNWRALRLTLVTDALHTVPVKPPFHAVVLDTLVHT